MDPHYPATREDLYHVQMEVKHVQVIQSDHADRLLRLERRQAADAALKSVWTSPFPSVLSGTPQHGEFDCSISPAGPDANVAYVGPVQTHSNDVFDDFDDEQGQNLLGSLQLETEGEPVRRGASRANSVRFDVSALQGSNWGHSSRNSGDFGILRPGSGFGSHPMTERSSSHKSDGRHSSAGHSVHSVHSGRTSSLGLDTNFMIGGRETDDSPSIDVPEPPPGLFLLGSVPSIIRCWLNTNFSHDALIYAVVCTGSRKSLLDYSLVTQLGLQHEMQKDMTGAYFIRLPVYLPEAIITQPSSRSNSPAPQLPTLTASFEVIGVSQRDTSERKKGLRIFIGSDTLRAHSTDLLFSQNIMTLYGDDRNKLSVPFVRPEDENLFKNLCTTNVLPERNELKATAIPFTPVDQKPKEEVSGAGSEPPSINGDQNESPDSQSQLSPTAAAPSYLSQSAPSEKSVPSDQSLEARNEQGAQKDDIDRLRNSVDSSENTEHSRRESSGGIWSSWRKDSTSALTNDASKDTTGNYQRAGRGGRSMKVLKPSKSLTTNASRSSSGARTGAAYEPVPRISSESRRKSQVATVDGNGAPLRWEAKRTTSEDKTPKDLRTLASVPRSSNPIGGASAFAWMNPNKPKTSATAE
jgi:hypothetical protein